MKSTHFSNSLLLFCAAVCLLAFPFRSAQANSKSPADKLWETEDGRYIIAAGQCGDTLCGTIYWMSEDVLPVDAANPDPGKRGNPLCGMEVMRGFRRGDDGNWVDGTIYRPETGRIYQATLKIQPSGDVLVHGYILLPVFGQTMLLRPVTADKRHVHCRK